MPEPVDLLVLGPGRFSKKVENHAAAVALHFMYVNFARPHKSLTNPYRGLRRRRQDWHIWTCEDIAALLD